MVLSCTVHLLVVEGRYITVKAAPPATTLLTVTVQDHFNNMMT